MNGPNTNIMPTPGESLIGERLHVCVGATCNNNCIFCMERDRDSRFRRLSAQTCEDVRRMMTVEPRPKEVMFTSGEPTLNPELPKYIAMARDLGYETVGMITNGRRLSYMAYARTLLEAGLNHVLVSIHGPDAKTHDALTRTRGAFEQAISGLANLAALRRQFPSLKVHTSYVVNRRNMYLFRQFYDAMLPFRVDQHVFNVMMPDGRGADHFDVLMPRYSDVAAEFARFVADLPPEGVSRVFLLDIPYCTTEGLPSSVRGYVERYFHFEPEGEVKGLLPDARPKIEGETKRYAMVAKNDRDEAVRCKRPECGSCGYIRHCRGVFLIYIERFGWQEFVPVRNKPKGA